MNDKNKIDEMILVLKGFKEGKIIEVCLGDGKWEKTKNPTFDFSTFNYRIKPWKKLFWHNIYFNNKTRLPELGNAHSTKSDAMANKRTTNLPLVYLKTVTLMSGEKYKVFY